MGCCSTRKDIRFSGMRMKAPLGTYSDDSIPGTVWGKGHAVTNAKAEWVTERSRKNVISRYCKWLAGTLPPDVCNPLSKSFNRWLLYFNEWSGTVLNEKEEEATLQHWKYVLVSFAESTHTKTPTKVQTKVFNSRIGFRVSNTATDFRKAESQTRYTKFDFEYRGEVVWAESNVRYKIDAENKRVHPVASKKQCQYP